VKSGFDLLLLRGRESHVETDLTRRLANLFLLETPRFQFFRHGENLFSPTPFRGFESIKEHQNHTFRWQQNPLRFCAGGFRLLNNFLHPGRGEYARIAPSLPKITAIVLLFLTVFVLMGGRQQSWRRLQCWGGAILNFQ